MGKVQNGQLFGEDSPDEDGVHDSQCKQFMDRLKRGEVRDVGQAATGLDVTAPIIERNISSSSVASSSIEKQDASQPSAPVPRRASRFKEQVSSSSSSAFGIPMQDREQSTTSPGSEVQSSKIPSTAPVSQVKEGAVPKAQRNGFSRAPKVISIPGIKPIVRFSLNLICAGG